MYASTEQLSLRSKQPTWVLQLAQVQLVPLAEIDAVGDVKDKDAVQKLLSEKQVKTYVRPHSYGSQNSM